MDNILIGITSRDENINGVVHKIISKNNTKYLHGKCSYIGLIDYKNDIDLNILKICDGIILTGGTDIYEYHFKIVNYCLNNNIPILGICMGHQILGLYSFNGKDEDLIKINGHYKTEHTIKINKDSSLQSILGDKIVVNSRHNYALPKNKINYKIGATSNDGIIESIEYIDDNHFLLGVEWHPEDMDNMEGLYNYFLKEVLIRKKTRQ